MGASGDNDLAHIIKVLKGADEAITRAWKDCGFDMYARLIYKIDDRYDKVRVMCSRVPRKLVETDGYLPEQLGVVIKARHRKVKRKVFWVTEPNTNVFTTPYVALGNEPSLGYTYANVACIVDVGPFGDRKGRPISNKKS